MGVGSYRRIDGPDGAAASGWEDSSLASRRGWQAGDGGARPDAAVIVATTLPTVDRERGGTGLQPEAVLALAWDPAPRLGLGVNVGYAYPGDGGERFHQGFGSVALGWSAGARLGLLAELYGFTEEEHGGDGASYTAIPTAAPPGSSVQTSSSTRASARASRAPTPTGSPASASPDGGEREY